MERHTNDRVALVPRTEITARAIEIDMPGLVIGVAEYGEGPTGCTVFSFPQGVAAAADVRGGAHATIYTDALQHGDGWLHAICLAGGSFYGLEAATGVAAELFAMRDYTTSWMQIALVSGAIIFDYGSRENAIYPDKALGRAALRAAQPGRFPIGAHGAGASATVGKGIDRTWGEPAGQGCAYRRVGQTRIAVFTVVNAVGAIVNRQGQVVRGNYDGTRGIRRQYAEAIVERLTAPPAAEPGNTTLTVVVTNRRLGSWSLRQLGRQVHASMARAIQPWHCPSDGDVLYAVTTNDIDETAPDPTALGVLASELAWDAVLCSFDEDTPSAE